MSARAKTASNDQGGELQDARGGRFWMDDDIIDQHAAKIGPYALAVYTYLCRRANKQKQAIPSLKRMGIELSMSRSTVQKAIETLEAHRLVSVTARKLDDSQEYTSNLYTILDASHGIGVPSHNTPIPPHGTPYTATQPTVYRETVTKEDTIKEDTIKDIAADAAPPQKPANPSKKKATSRQTPIQPEAVMVPPAPPVAPEQAAADLAAWDALEAAPPEARHGRAPSFQNDHWGWYEGLIYVTTGWTRREFEQKKSETVQKAYHAHAKKHHGLGRHVKTLLENFAPGGWRWQTHAYKTSKPNLGEIDQLWGDWEQTPVLNFPPPSAPRAAYVPPPIPEDVVKLDQNRRRELRRLGLLQAGGLNGSLISHEKHAG